MKKFITIFITICLSLFITNTINEKDIFTHYTFTCNVDKNDISYKDLDTLALLSEKALASFILDNVKDSKLYRLLYYSDKKPRKLYKKAYLLLLEYSIQNYTLLIQPNAKGARADAYIFRDTPMKFEQAINISIESLSKYENISTTALNKVKNLYNIC